MKCDSSLSGSRCRLVSTSFDFLHWRHSAPRGSFSVSPELQICDLSKFYWASKSTRDLDSPGTTDKADESLFFACNLVLY